MNYDTTTTEGKANVMLAHANGEVVQSIGRGNAEIYGWRDDKHPAWDWLNRDHRIKPKEPRRWWLSPVPLNGRGHTIAYIEPQADTIEVVEVQK